MSIVDNQKRDSIWELVESGINGYSKIIDILLREMNSEQLDNILSLLRELEDEADFEEEFQGIPGSSCEVCGGQYPLCGSCGMG